MSNTPAIGTILSYELDNGPGSPFGLRAQDVRIAARLNQLAKMVSGKATIANGDTSVDVTLDAALDGSPVQLTFAESAGSAAKLFYVWNGTGVLSITVDTDPGKDLDVAYFVDGRTTADLS
jgi:hypothetical protein